MNLDKYIMYDKPFIKIDGVSYELSDISNYETLEIIESYSAGGELNRSINEIKSYESPEITTAWLSEYDYNSLISKLKSPIITVEGLLLSPYFYDITEENITFDSISSLKFHPTITGNDKNMNLYRVSFELELV